MKFLSYENQYAIKEFESGAYLTTYGMWRCYSRAVNTLCPDEKRRTITLDDEPDTFFSIPGHVSYGKSTVKGVVFSPFDNKEDLVFAPHTPRHLAIKMYHDGNTQSPWDDEVLLEKLKEEAEDAMRWRGHEPGTWEKQGEGKAIIFCVICGKDVQVIVKPKPNEIDIGGPAVAVGCED